MFKVPEEFRQKLEKGHPMFSTKEHGNNGTFEVTLKDGKMALIIASDGMRWEHVSVSVYRTEQQGDKQVCISQMPTWDDMCEVKDMFWEEEDCVVQFHPPKSQYVNNAAYVLHLWSSSEDPMPCPESIMVGML